MMNPESFARFVLGKYVTALKSLQVAVTHPTRWLSADVLSTTEILALFEVG